MAQPREAPSQPRAYSQAIQNGVQPPVANPVPGARPLEPNQGRVQQIGHVRVLCVADVRGNLRQLNDLARSAKANYIVHTGDFGFYDEASLDRIAEKTLKHVAQYSPLLPEPVKADIARTGTSTSIKERFQRERLPLSELTQFLDKTYKLEVPVYTVWGACEDVSVLEKLRSGEYKIDNLHVIDESHSRLLDIGGVKLRLLGLGGAVVMHKMFDNGEGRTTIAGGQGTMWTTLLQIGELIDTANRVYDPTETRLLITHASPAREGLLNQLSVALKADFSISAGLHFRYGSSYNEFSVNPSLDHYRGKLSASKAQFNDVWDTVKHEVEPAVSENEAQHKLLMLALDLVNKMPATASGGNPFGGGPPNGQVDESAFKNMWNFNLADAAFGWLVLDIDQGRIGTEMRAQGFNFSHRGGKAQQRPAVQAAVPVAAASATPTGNLAQRPAPQTANVQPIGANQPLPGIPQGNAYKQQQQVAQPKPNQSQNTSQTAQPLTSTTPQPTPTTNLPKDASQINGKGQADANKPSNGHAASPLQEPSKGIFISGLFGNHTVEDVKANLFSSEDSTKITSIDKTPKAFIVHFATPETMQEVLKHGIPSDVGEPFKTARLSALRDRPSVRGGAGGAGSWNARGGPSFRGNGEGRGGFQAAGSGNAGSDSESGRGGRGRGGRGGSFRGERGGRGRGGRGGAGGKPEGTPTGTPAPASGGDS